jgi:hypothetical protein
MEEGFRGDVACGSGQESHREYRVKFVSPDSNQKPAKARRSSGEAGYYEKKKQKSLLVKSASTNLGHRIGNRTEEGFQGDVARGSS